MKFKFISTRVCTSPSLRNGHLVLSYDGFLWKSASDINAIRSRFLDQFGVPLSGPTDAETEHYQPKNLHSLESLGNDFIPCAFAVEESAYDLLIERSGYVPSRVYEEQGSNLVLLGYEVLASFDTSAFCHGLSPYSEGSEGSLNKFGLIKTIEEGLLWVKMNNSQIPEHGPWFLMALYVSEGTKTRLDAILKTPR